MIKFDKDEFLKTCIYSTNDEYEVRCKVTKEIVDDVKQLQQENQELKKHLEVPKQCNLKTIEDYKSYYEDATKEEILKDTYIDYCAYVNLAHRYAELKKQLEYLRSGEYLNQLKFEIKEDKEFIDMTHRNTELLEENQSLKKQLEERPKEYVFIGNAQNKTRDFINQITKDNKEYKNQQKEFIKYLEDYIKEMEEEIGNSMTEPYKKSHTIRRNVYQEILQKYKSIIGVSDEKEN